MATDHDFRIKNGLQVENGFLLIGKQAFSSSDGYMGIKTSNMSGVNDYMMISGTGDNNTYISAKTGASVIVRSGGNTSTHQLVVSSAGASFDGNLTVAGNFTVNGTTTTLNTATLNVEDKNIVLNYGSGDTSGSANGAGITIQDAVNGSTDATILWDQSDGEFDFSHGISFPDNKIARFGTSSDLRIYHSGTESWIKDSGSGSLYIDTDGPSIQLTSGNSAKNMVQAVKDGAVNLFYNNSQKLATTSAGINITGTISSGAITASGSSVFNPTSDMVIVNEPSTNTDLQTAMRVGTAAGGLFFTTNNAIISKGAYYDGGWIATSTTGSSIDFTGNDRLTFNTFSGATVGGTAAFGARAYVDTSGLTITSALNFTNNPATIQNSEDNSGQIIIQAKNSSGTFYGVRWDVANASTGALRPSHTNNSNLGLTNRVWNTLYVNNIRIGSANTQVIDASRNLFNIGLIKTNDGSASAPAYSFTSDTDTGIFRASADALAFTTGGARRGYFASSGIHSDSNVYIGTNSSFRNYGGVWRATTGLTGNGFSFANSVDGTALTVSSTGNAVFSGTISSGTVTTSGNFVGTSGHVQTAGAYFSGDIRVLNNAGDGWNTFAARSSGIYNLSNIGTLSSGAITTSGDLTITKQTPLLTLETASNSTNPEIRLKSSGGFSSEGFGIYYDNNVGDAHFHTTYANNNAALKFYTATGGSPSTSNLRLKIGGDGNFSFNNGNFTSVGTISSGAITSTGRSTFDSVTIDDDGSGSPLLRVVGDDHSPWLFQLENDSATNDGLFQAYIANDNNLYFRAKETGAYPTWYFQISNASNHVNSMYLNSSGINSPGHVDVSSVKISGTTVIDSSRNISAVGITSSGAVNVGGDLNISSVLAHTGDLDTYFQFNAANTARIVVGGSQKFVVNTSGVTINNGGFGANVAPNASYAINALQSGSLTRAAYFQANGGTGTGLEINATAGTYSGDALYVRQSTVSTGGNLARFANSSGDKFTITTAGSVAMGGTTVINSSRQAQNITLLGGTSGARFQSSNWIYDDDNDGRLYFAINGPTYYKSTSGHRFRANGDVTRLTIDADGRVNLYSGGDTNAPGGAALAVAGTSVLTTGRVLQNVSVDTTTSIAPAIRGSVAGVDNTGYVHAFKVDGNSLSSQIRFTVGGTVGSVVFSNDVSIVCNHYRDILIESTSGFYTILTIKVVSNGNEDFSVFFKSNSANTATVNIVVFPLNDETVTITTTDPSYSGITLEHTCDYGKKFSATNNTTPDQFDITTDGDIDANKYQINGTTVIGADRVLQVADGSVASPTISFSADTNTGLYRVGSDKLGFVTAGAYRGMFDNSGNLLVGTTNTVPGAGNTVTGVSLYNDGRIFAAKDGNTVMSLNRNSSNGVIAEFRYAGNLIGNMGVEGGDSFFIQSDGTGGGGLRFHNSGRISPMRNGALIDNTIELGAATQQFASLYLGTGLYMGGTQIVNSSRTLSNVTASGDIITSVTTTDDPSWHDVVLYSSSGLRRDTAVEVHGSGYLRASYLNMTHSAGNRTADSVFFSSNDTYIRKNTASGFRTSLDVYSKAESVALFTDTGDIDLGAGSVLTRSNHHTGHMEGSYNNIGGNGSKSNPIYTIGSGYNPTDAALSNMYGIGYAHSNQASFLSGMNGGGWGLYVASDGDARIFLDAGGGVVHSTSGYKVGNTSVIDSSRNLNNIASITASGNMTITGELKSLNAGTNAIKTRFISGAANASTSDGNLYLQHAKTNDIYCFNGTSGNPRIRIYGNDSGVGRYGDLLIGTDGSFNISASDTYLILNAGTYIQSNKNHNFIGSILFAGTTVIDSNRNATFEQVTLGSGGNIILSGTSKIHLSGATGTDYLEFDDDSTTYTTGSNATVLASKSDVAIRTNTNDGGGGRFTVVTGNSSPSNMLVIESNGNATFSGELDAVNGFEINGTSVINSSRHLANVTVTSAEAEGGQSLNGNFGQWQSHSTYTNFNTDVNYWGWNFVQGNTNAPHTASSQWYRNRVSLGNGYGHGLSSGDYWLEVASPRLSPANGGHMYIRQCENGSIGSWYEVGSNLRSSLNVGVVTSADINLGATSTNARLIIKKADNNQPDHIQIFCGSTQTGEIGSQDTTWLRINQTVAKNIYTPRYIRADSGFFVDNTATGLDGSGRLRAFAGSNSSVGIGFANDINTGFTNPSADTIDVVTAGDAHARFDSTGNLIVEGNVTAYGSVSDIRLKENIEVIPDAVEKVQKLEGITFNYKKDGGRSTGLIAQQLQEVLPEAVYKAKDLDEEEHLAVKYGNVVGLLVEAIKEQQTQLTAQQEQINQLTTLVNTLMEK